MESDKFMTRIQRDISGCWTWLGSVTGSGYPNMKVAGKNVYAYIYSWQLRYGHLADDKKIVRLCDNKLCCNPDHYKLDHKRNPDISYPAVVEDINAGLKMKQIIEKHGCSPMTYFRYKKRMKNNVEV